MPTAAQIANSAKIRLQQEVVSRLRAGGRDNRSIVWDRIEGDDKLWADLGSYDLQNKERRSHLNKVAFPDANKDDVDAALAAGNNLNKLYELALGKSRVAKDSKGHRIKGKHGLRIVS